MRRMPSCIIIAIIVALLAACSPAPSPQPTPSLDGTLPPESPRSTAAITPATPAPTTVTPTVVATQAGHVVVWHGFAPDSVEERAVMDAIAEAGNSLDDVEIDVRPLPGNELVNRFEIEAVAGGGADLIFVPGDSLGREAQAGLLHSLDNLSEEQLAVYMPVALETMRVNGKLYGLPISLTTVGLYYNRTNVEVPPQTTQQLLEAVKNGKKVTLIRSAFHNFGFFGAFGGTLMNEQGVCIADQGGFAEALAFLDELKTAGAQFVTNSTEAEELFRSGQTDMLIDGSWLLTDFQAALGDQLGVAPLPNGPGGPARALVSTNGVVVNANTEQAETASLLALGLTSPTAQTSYAEQPNWIPTSLAVTTDDTRAQFVTIARTGVARPQRPELDAFWPAFDRALAEVLETDVDPVEAVKTACAAMNAANGK